MCNLKNQTAQLLGTPPIVPPQFILPLINAYIAHYPINTLDLNVYAEPYYGDFDNCSAVLLTHNPGQAKVTMKGIGSEFEHSILDSENPIEINYHNLAVNNQFPNNGTNRWVNTKNVEFVNLFQGITVFENRLFIRDLVPYHGQVFGSLPMIDCIEYLYKYFFCQVIGSSFKSELYEYLNKNNSKKKSSILIARGAAWNGLNGLSSVGWDLVGRIYSNLYVYKLNFDKLKKLTEICIENCIKDIFEHDIFIVVITPKKGGRVIVYKTKGGITNDFNMLEIVSNYNTNYHPSDRFYIERSEGMDEFINCISA